MNYEYLKFQIMKTKITIILVLFFCCILGNKAQEKIIGGQTIDISQAPHQVGFFCKKIMGYNLLVVDFLLIINGY